MKLFGFTIKREKEGEKDTPSFVPRDTDDGAMVVAPGGAYGTYIDLDGTVRSEAQLVNRYREMAQNQEVDSAIDDIINQAIVQDPDVKTVTINLDNTTFSEKIKDKIREEFETILKLYDFNLESYKIFRQWYIDGRLYYHIVIDPSNPKAGIKELRYIDPRKIKKIREVRKSNPDKVSKISLIDFEQEYYIFNPKGFTKNNGNGNAIVQGSSTTEGIRIAKDSIVYVSSGLLDKTHTIVISYLHKAIKPLNNLRSLEDSVVIYRISRAPERRIFYIDVGNLPKIKAEQYMNDIMTKYKNRLVYNAETGETRDDRRWQTMLEDFWLPRREGGRGTEISTLPAGQNLDQLEDVKYFQKQLYKSLNIPTARLESEQIFSLGRGAEISRDEDKFADFITRLRLQFSSLFIQALEKQLILKNIITPKEWDDNKQNIKIRYAKNSYYSEIRENEVMNMRLETLDEITDYVGIFFSKRWVQKNVLRMTEDEIEQMNNEILEEIEDNENMKLEKDLSDLRITTQVHQQAQKDGIVIDPNSGNVMPDQLMKPDPTYTRD